LTAPRGFDAIVIGPSLDIRNYAISLSANYSNDGGGSLASSDAVWKALADPTRREILHLLRSGPKTSGEIAEAFPSAWATISRHLSVLRQAGLVSAERNGSSVVYELETTVFQDTVEHLLSWILPRGSNAKRRT
jgi:ArsR family transcriptional regulator, arsenate/arsenite/antimonite-responsive transcriptional repressor